MGSFWFWFTSKNHTKRGFDDAQDGLPKKTPEGEVMIPPHLNVIKDTYEAKIAGVVDDWSKEDGDLDVKLATLRVRKEGLTKRKSEKSHWANFSYMFKIFALGLLEIPITFIALESVFKENLVLVLLTCIGFSVLIVALGHMLGQMIYQESILEKSSRLTIVVIVTSILIMGGLSYLRYINQSNIVFDEKVAIQEEAELSGGIASPLMSEKIKHLNEKSPAGISIVFFTMSAGFMLLAIYISRQHCLNNTDDKYKLSLTEFLDEKIMRLEKQRDSLYRHYDAVIDQLRQSAQREFWEYIDGLIRSEQNDGGTMKALTDKISGVFQVETGKMLESFALARSKILRHLEQVEYARIEDESV